MAMRKEQEASAAGGVAKSDAVYTQQRAAEVAHHLYALGSQKVLAPAAPGLTRFGNLKRRPKLTSDERIAIRQERRRISDLKQHDKETAKKARAATKQAGPSRSRQQAQNSHADSLGAETRASCRWQQRQRTAPRKRVFGRPRWPNKGWFFNKHTTTRMVYLLANTRDNSNKHQCGVVPVCKTHPLCAAYEGFDSFAHFYRGCVFFPV